MEMQNDDDYLQGSTKMNPFWDDDFIMLKGDDLLDYLVGSDINLSDFNSFGADERLLVQVNDSSPTVVNTEKSPWHESDSGMSETLSVGSPSDLSSPGKMSREDPFQDSVFYHKKAINIYPQSSATASSVSQFLSEKNEAPSSAKTTQTDIARTVTHTSASGRPTRRCSRKPQIEQSDSEDSESMESQPKKRSSSMQSVTCNKNEVASSGRANVVNIVKIIKPATQDTTSDDILKALDEKSKKNAQQAKINREKKKMYIKSLEDDRDNLVKENNQLSTKIGRMTEEMQDLQEEVCYLKSVLANSSSLSELLRNISNVKSVKLSASMTNHKRAFEGDHSYMSNRPAKKTRFARENFKKAGVCLHVSDGEACLEFCAHCSLLAHKTREQS